MRHNRLIGGVANTDDYRIGQTGGGYDAIAVRTFNAKARQWAIWWFDTRYPELDLGTPVRGGFAGGSFAAGDLGLFYSTGKTAITRFVWRKLADGRPQWEQATSTDRTTWAPNWRFVLTPA